MFPINKIDFDYLKINNFYLSDKKINNNPLSINYIHETYSILDKFIHSSKFPRVVSQVEEDLSRMAMLFIQDIPRHFAANDETALATAFQEFAALLDTYTDSGNFIRQGLQGVHAFLDVHFFKNGFFFAGDDKQRVKLIAPLFAIVDRHIGKVDKLFELYSMLKLQLANLPKPKPLEEYPNLALTEKEKLEILRKGIDRKILSAVAEIRTVTAKECLYLAKLCSTRSVLSAKVRPLLAQKVEDWDDVRLVQGLFMKAFPTPVQQEGPATRLYRLNKMRAFFEKQKDLPEAEVFIPTWYHATKKDAIEPILDAGKIEVRHEGTVRGCFVSTQRESTYGQHAFAISRRVVALDPEPADTFNQNFKRWRGLQQAISLTKDFFGIISYPKADKVQDKPFMRVALVTKGYSHIALHSEVQLDFMQKTVAEIIGCPDLPEGWRSGDKFYSPHQLAMQKKAKTLAEQYRSTPPLFAGQVAVSNIVQGLAIPLYKEVMPLNPSYKAKDSSTRISLGRNSNRHELLEKVAKKVDTARDIHGTMHAARTALWSQLLLLLYKDLGVQVMENEVYVALTAALHDAARENEGTDFWDDESAELVAIQMRAIGVSEVEIVKFRHAVSQKDAPISTNVQGIVHDADCLEIMRLCRLSGFLPDNLHFYRKNPEKKEYLDALIAEVAEFIATTDTSDLKVKMEHTSPNIYADLVRLLLSDTTKFPKITELLLHSAEFSKLALKK